MKIGTDVTDYTKQALTVCVNEKAVRRSPQGIGAKSSKVQLISPTGRVFCGELSLK